MAIDGENHPVGETPPPLLRKEGSQDTTSHNQGEEFVCNTPDDTFALGERIGRSLDRGDVVLLYGGLGAGKTLLTKGILKSLRFDVDEVTSPSFALVNLYKTEKFNVYHIDLWRLDGVADPAVAVGLGDILENENAVTIIEWADRLGEMSLSNRVIKITIEGDGEDPRRITISREPNRPVAI